MDNMGMHNRYVSVMTAAESPERAAGAVGPGQILLAERGKNGRSAARAHIGRADLQPATPTVCSTRRCVSSSARTP
jgi:hypothetical protein